MGMYAPKVKVIDCGNGEMCWVPESHIFTPTSIAEMIVERCDEDVDVNDIANQLDEKYDVECANFVSQYIGWEGMIDELPDTAPMNQENEIVKLASLVGIELESFE